MGGMQASVIIENGSSATIADAPLDRGYEAVRCLSRNLTGFDIDNLVDFPVTKCIDRITSEQFDIHTFFAS